MFKIDTKKNIHITRGDVGTISVGALNEDGTAYTFQPNDVVRFQVMQARKCDQIETRIDVRVLASASSVDVSLTEQDTTIGGVINKPTDYWYEIELNPESNSQTIIGYDEDGPKLFKLYPEGSEGEIE